MPYTKPLGELWRADSIEFVFAAIDKLLYYFNGLRFFFVRDHARRQCLEWILLHQEASGDWAGIFPPMHVGLMALILEGYSVEDDCVQRGLKAVERFAWQDDDGKRIQACVSPVWDTILMTVGLHDAGGCEQDGHLRKAVDWIKAHQLLGSEGDWRVYSPGLKPGGFSFEYFNSWYPDVDDTAAAILAFLKQDFNSISSSYVTKAAEWILGMQNEDGGWAAFDLNNNKLFLNKIPFSDMDSLCDPSTADVTGRILEAFGLMIKITDSSPVDVNTELLNRIETASLPAIEYLTRNQEPTGAWYGRWGSNYIYGTSNVLCGLSYFKENPGVQCLVGPAVKWLRKVQNADGGFGESLDTYKIPKRAGCGTSTASQTAWGTMALLACLPPMDEAISRSVLWLMSAQTKNNGNGATWPEAQYTGTGFPKFFYLGYALYPHYFPLMALGRYWKARTSA